MKGIKLVTAVCAGVALLSAATLLPRERHDVWPQSFNINDVLYWIKNEPRFGRQAVYLDNANVVDELPGFQELQSYKARGINIWAPPTFALLSLDANDRIVPSQHARWAGGVFSDWAAPVTFYASCMGIK